MTGLSFMAFLVSDPEYGKTGRIDEEFQKLLLAELNGKFGDVRVGDVDAGPGAADPAYWVEILNLTGATLAVLGAGSLIRDNLILWKNIFDKISSYFVERKLSYFIDAKAARCLALHYVVSEFGKKEIDGIEVSSLTRHGFNMLPRVGEVSISEVEPLDQDDIDAHYVAVDQMHCRYVACVTTISNCYTVVIEGNGECAFICPLFRK